MKFTYWASPVQEHDLKGYTQNEILITVWFRLKYNGQISFTLQISVVDE